MQNWDNLIERFLSGGIIKNDPFLEFSKQPKTFVSSETYLEFWCISKDGSELCSSSWCHLVSLDTFCSKELALTFKLLLNPRKEDSCPKMCFV